MQILAPKYMLLELIQGAFWVQNGKNDGFTKMSVDRIVKIVHSGFIVKGRKSKVHFHKKKFVKLV